MLRCIGARLNRACLSCLCICLPVWVVATPLQPTVKPLDFPQEKAVFSAQEKAWIKANPSIVYGIEEDWQPFSFVDKKGVHQGIARDFLDKISTITGLTFKPLLKDWFVLLKDMRENRLDLIPALLKTKKRQKFYAYSDPYIVNIPYFFTRIEDNFNNLTELNGKTAAIPKGYIYHKVLQKHYPEIKFIRPDSMQEAVNAVLEHRADILIDSHTAMSYFLNQRGIASIRAFKPLSANITRDVFMAAPKDKQILIDIINKAMQAITPAEKQAIMQYWLGSSQKELMVQLELTESEKNWLTTHHHINYAGDPNWQPFEFFNQEGKYAGIVADYLKLFAKALDISWQIIPSNSWEQTVNKLKTGEVDIISEVMPSPLNKQFLFTQPYLTTPIVMIAKEQVQYVNGLSDLTDMQIGVVRDYGYVAQIKAKYPNLQFIPVSTVQDGLFAVSTGKVEVLLASLAAATYQMSEQGLNNIRVVGKTEFNSELAFAINPKFAPLVGILNKSINHLDAKDRQQILSNWGKAHFVTKMDYHLVVQVIAAALLLVLIIWLWNRKLSKEVTLRKQSEARLHLLNERFNLAMQAVSFGVWELGYPSEKAVPKLSIDKNMRQIYNLKEDRVSFNKWLDCMLEASQKALNQAIIQARITGQKQELELQLKGQPKKIIYSALQVDKSSEQLKIVGINWDITPLKDSEQKLAEAKNIAEQANRAKSDFLANMSHEIRTPMNAILGFSELLDEQISEPRLKAFVKTIRGAGNNLLALINDILDLSKIEAGQFDIQKAPCNLTNLLNEVSQIFALRAQEKNLNLQVQIDPAIPASLNLDAVRVRQILLNLIGNAVKFTEQGSIEVHAQATNEDDIRSKVDLLIEVRDSGIGIAKEEQDRVFQKFAQSSGQDVSKYGGTGLGLSISHRLAEMMGGVLSLASSSPAGSTFVLHLKGIDISSVVEVQPESTTDEFEFAPSQVLVVDDVAANLELVSAHFAPTALTVYCAENGLKAVQMVQQQDFDLILMDIRMPVMDGYQAAEKIKALTNTPIVALTASVMQNEFERIKRAHFDGYLRKPVLRQALFTEVARHLKHQLIKIEEDPTQIATTLTPVQRQTLLELLPKYQHLQAECEALAKANHIPSIQAFVDKLKQLNQDSDLSILNEYIETLEQDLASFNIIGIKGALQHYAKLLEQLQQWVS